MASEKRLLLIGGVSLVKGRLRDIGLGMVKVCDALEPVLREVDFVRGAPFQTVSLVVRFGTRRRLIPEYRAIDDSHGELPVSVELDMKQAQHMTREELAHDLTIVALHALIDIGLQFSLPVERITLMRDAMI